jgi:hypothetical protein
MTEANANDLYYATKELVSTEMLMNQTSLVEYNFSTGTFERNDIINSSDKEILNWILVTDYMAKALKSKGEAVLDHVFGEWWGRTTIGQEIAQDGIIQEIARDYLCLYRSLRADDLLHMAKATF